MITPAEIRRKAEDWWNDRSFLRAWLTNEPYFPKSVGRIGLDNEAALLVNFARIYAEQEALRQQSRNALGYGYTLKWSPKNKHKLGQVQLIHRITFETSTDWLKYTERETAFVRFTDLVALTRQQVPELEPWLHKYPLRLLDNADDWPNWLAICRFFRDTYVPDRYYVRQLPLLVHTKFLEEKNSLLLSLLAVVQPTLIRSNQKDWRKKLGLLVPEPMIRVRALGDELRLDGKHEDFGLPLSAFARHIQPAQRIFICENLLSFLTFPKVAYSIAIWGSGFAVTLLGGTDWLGAKQLYYWGDIDVHGFQILSEIRALYSDLGVQSLLMDWETFRRFHQGERGGAFNSLKLDNLTEEESHLYNILLAENWRVEQEKITEEWVSEVLKEI